MDALKAVILDNVEVLPQWQGIVASGGRLNLLKAAEELAPPPPPPGGTTGAFIETDTTTRGDWFVKYGVDGYRFQPDVVQIPPYAQLGVSASTITWADPTTDIRALQRPDGSGRTAAAWLGMNMVFAIPMTDGQLHDVAFYALDWDDLGRAQRFEVISGITGQVLATHTISGFREGVYVVFRLSGNVLVRVSSTVTSPPNTTAVVSGIFFGGPATSGIRP